MTNKLLGGVCENLDNKRIPITKSKRLVGNIPYYGASGIVDYVSDYIFNEDLLLVSEDGANLLARTYPIAFSISGKTWVNNHAHVLRFKNRTSQKFIEYYLNSINLEPFVNGMAQPKLNQKSLNSIPVPFPPLPEQKRIVAMLDEAFAGIDRAIANTEKNLASAREIFESYLNGVFTRKGEGWEEKILDDVCIVERGSSPRPIKSYITQNEDGVNWIKIGDTKGIQKYIRSTKQKITSDGALKSRRVVPGDFILTNSMSFGKPYIMATTGCIHDGWFVLRLKEDICREFLFHLLSSRYVQDQFRLLAAGAVVKNISSDLVKKTILPIPTKSMQSELVKRFDIKYSTSLNLEVAYRQKIVCLNELKQSLLQKAFSGELTADMASNAEAAE